MSLEKAKAHYTGKEHPRLNCAQALAHAFKDKFNLSEGVVADFASCGGGRVPGGVCGAFYVVRSILEKAHPEKAKACESAFLSAAGSLQCREIRSSRKLSCVGCVETAAECLVRV